MNKPFGYDEADSYEFGQGGEVLPPGGYMMIIKKAEVQRSKNNREMLVLYLDVAEGEHKGHFQNLYNTSTANPKKYPNGGIYRQLVDGSSTPFFKGLITAIEKSNYSYKWNWDERTLQGKAIGGIVGREQYKKTDGTLAFATKVVNVCSCERILTGVEPPADKMLQEQANNGFDMLGQEISLDEIENPFY